MEIMTLDEAIKHAEEVAEKNEKKCTDGQLWSVNESRRKCSAEHRQLAAWLKELKGYRSIKDQIAFVKRNIEESRKNNERF